MPFCGAARGLSDAACGQGTGHGARSAKGVGPALRRILRGQRQHRLRAGAVRSLRKRVSGLGSCCVGGCWQLVQRMVATDLLSCSAIPATHASLGSGAGLGPADHHTHRARAASRRTSRASCPTAAFSECQAERRSWRPTPLRRRASIRGGAEALVEPSENEGVRCRSPSERRVPAQHAARHLC